MKICVIGPAFPLRGGISHYNTLMCQYLKKNHQVYPISFHRQYPSLFFPGTTQIDMSKEPLFIKSSSMIDSLNPYTWWKVFLYIKKIKPDMVIYQWWHPFFAPIYRFINSLLWKLQISIVYICHNVIPHESSFLDQTLCKIAFHDVTGFLVHSKSEKAKLKAIIPEAKNCCKSSSYI